MKLSQIILLLTTVVISTTCKNTEKSSGTNLQTGDSLFISLDRSPCFGKCPWYSVKIFDSGYTIYDGKKDVSMMAINTTFLAKSDLKKLKEKAMAIGYMNLNDKYDNPRVTDLPTTESSVKIDGVRKSIVNRYQGPKELKEFENYIDTILATKEFQKQRPIDRK